jgi:hypothetical protein
MVVTVFCLITRVRPCSRVFGRLFQPSSLLFLRGVLNYLQCWRPSDAWAIHCPLVPCIALVRNAESRVRSAVPVSEASTSKFHRAEIGSLASSPVQRRFSTEHPSSSSDVKRVALEYWFSSDRSDSDGRTSFNTALPVTRQLADRADCLLIAGIFPSVDNAIR